MHSVFWPEDSTAHVYPTDMQLLDTETVLKQAEMIADELAG